MPNKLTTALKQTILEALDEAQEDGGKGYLIKVAQEQPAVFCGLLGKVLPSGAGRDRLEADLMEMQAWPDGPWAHGFPRLARHVVNHPGGDEFDPLQSWGLCRAGS